MNIYYINNHIGNEDIVMKPDDKSLTIYCELITIFEFAIVYVL